MNSQRRLAVFIGSPKRGLERIRQSLTTAILEAGHIPSGMELWAAGSEPTLEAIARELNMCDIHVIILGSRYGSRLGKKKESYTEWEFRQSSRCKRPVIAFLLDVDDFNKERKAIRKSSCPEDVEEQTDDTDNALEKFRQELEQKAIVRYFQSKAKHSVTLDCVNSINQAINSGAVRDGAGWIRAESEYGETIRKIQTNPFLNRIISQMNQFSTLTQRLEKEEEAKKTLAALFWEVMYGRIEHCGYKDLFFESGSTLAYLSAEFEQKVKACGPGSESNWNVTTNNAITLLQLLLLTNIKTNPLPPAPPEGRYGAMFGHDLLEHPQSHPVEPRPLLPTEEAAVVETVTRLKQGAERRLFLATASGLDLRHSRKHFRGPHIGSHPNMLFKRAIFRTEEPVVLFLTEDKVGDPFDDTNCFPVFGEDLAWTSVLQDYPLAICIGYRKQKTADRLRDKFRGLREYSGFNFDYAHETRSNGGMLMATNKNFAKRFELTRPRSRRRKH